MKKLVSGLIVIALFSLQSAAFADSDWRKYSVTEEGEYYLDVNSIRKTGGLLRAWSMQDFKKTQVWDSTRYKSILELKQFDCENERSRTIQFTVFSQNLRGGIALFTSNEEEEFEYVTPDSRGAHLLKSVCNFHR